MSTTTRRPLANERIAQRDRELSERENERLRPRAEAFMARLARGERIKIGGRLTAAGRRR